MVGCLCAQGDSNSHGRYGPQGPQCGASVGQSRYQRLHQLEHLRDEESGGVGLTLRCFAIKRFKGGLEPSGFGAGGNDCRVVILGQRECLGAFSLAVWESVAAVSCRRALSSTNATSNRWRSRRNEPASSLDQGGDIAPICQASRAL
jgi:hypothetical protein